MEARITPLDQTQSSIIRTGKWVTASVYGRVYGFSEAVLANWRYRDRHADTPRDKATDGFPQYRMFGAAVRYWVPAEDVILAEQIASTLKATKQTGSAA
jgi:hypothetical protein